jgi:beta-galactosidase
VRFPNRVLCGSETFPKQIAFNWKLVQECSHVIGDFTWTGWDYLGEAGIGAMRYAEDGKPVEFNAPYPWYIAWCGDIDITGHRRPASYYREIVFGLRKEPYIAVRYPHNCGKTLLPGMWDFVDGISSWTWIGYEGKPVEVEVYAPGDFVELYCNNEKIGEAPLKEFKAVIETVYSPGELAAKAFQNGAEIGSARLATAGEGLRIAAAADRAEICANDADLCYIDIALTDDQGVVNNMADRPVTACVTGAGKLLGLGSANPKSEESFLAGTFTSFDGRLLAVVRPTGVGEIQVRVSAEGCEDALVAIKAI